MVDGTLSNLKTLEKINVIIMEQFLETYSEAAMTSLGLFWMAFWAFGLGYLISSIIQVFVVLSD